MVHEARDSQDRLVESSSRIVCKSSWTDFALSLKQQKSPTGYPVGLCFEILLGDVLACFSKLHVDATAILIEVDVAINTCMDGVVLAHVNIVAWVPLGATLADDDVAGDNFLAAKFFRRQDACCVSRDRF